MRRVLDEYESLRAEVALAFFKYVNLFNLLERNIVLCIAGFHSGSERKATMAQLSGLTMHGKMEFLRDLVADGQVKLDERLKAAFDEWFRFAVKSKASRNRYVHGYWDVVPHIGKPIRFSANQWGDEKDGASSTEHMTLEEYLGLMAEMDSVFEQFSAFRKKYRM